MSAIIGGSEVMRRGAARPRVDPAPVVEEQQGEEQREIAALRTSARSLEQEHS